MWGSEDDPRPQEDWLSVREVHAAVEEHRTAAYTTVMTVLDRLAAKGVIERSKEGRTNRYRASDSRGAMTAELMRDAMADLVDSDRRSALVAFVGDATDEERTALREALAELDRREG
ncbi:BlaI/MecI/CopY family transcriptional regulator [Nocardioides mangrovicus]|uniref:BlaI/MecI/CopY family transcriptional regulator n=2 Tax=Nocardioides mangrovicus TaxID=2478913 RepID=A0A3L8P4V5_9ACTN|nr:BlaI/MecI/CopY family transcriptional regulator [Nocardioides mangrovicus]